MFPSFIILLFVTLFSIGNGSFDDYILALQWPGTYCINATPNCTNPLPNRFTVHGLWPSNRTYPPPVERCSNVSLPPLRTIRQWSFAAELDLYWPNLNGNNINFWRHEWNVHGTCSTLCPKALVNLTGTCCPEAYFNLAVSLYKRLNATVLLGNLRNQSVVPRPESKGGYSLAKLKAAFKATLGGGTNDVLITCDQKKRRYLLEVRVYIEPQSLAPIPSPRRSNCNGTIIFPPIP